MTGIFDSHAHYDDARFDGMRDEVLTQIFADGTVAHVVNVATNLQNADTSIALAEAYPQIFAAVGIHPCDCLHAGEPEQAMTALAHLLEHDRVVALGEIGLDYHYDDTPRDVQKIWMRHQMALARECGVPVIVHDREAHGDCVDIVREFPEVKGVFHSFSGSAEMARDLLRRGWYLSFSGVITFKNAGKVLEALRVVPDDRLLLETDCPYLAPHPMRGQCNRSDYLVYTVSAAAEVRGCTPQAMAALTAENAARFFQISSKKSL